MSEVQLLTWTGKGVCYICGAKHSQRGMTNHIASHYKNQSGKDTHFVIRIDQGADSPFWMYVQIAQRARLVILDKFLRNVWLECCGHLSEFAKGADQIPMNKVIGKIVTKGDSLSYVYDFGSSTELSLSIVSVGPKISLRADANGSAGWTPPPMVYGEEKVKIVALHDKAEFHCAQCGGKATLICSQCSFYDEGVLCEKCVKKHKCGTDVMLPVVQSPRVGTCGFDGASLEE